MNKKLKLLANELGEARVKFDESLHYHTGSNLDINAEAFYIATNQKEFEQSLNTALELAIPFKVLGYDNIETPKKAGQRVSESANQNGTVFSDQLIRRSADSLKIEGLVIKNRTHLIRISGIKGKFVVGSMGIDQVLLEVDSGVSVGELKNYFIKSNLVQPSLAANDKLTFGEVLPTEFAVQGMIENIKVWEKGMVEEVSILEFQPKKQIVISVILRVKSNT